MADLTTLLSKFLEDLYAGTLGGDVPLTTVTIAAGGTLQFGTTTPAVLSRSAADTLALADGDTFRSAGGWWEIRPAAAGYTSYDGGAISWTSSSSPSGTIDTQLKRVAANISGPAVADGFGMVSAAWWSVAPTVASGFGTSPSIVASNGSAAFQVNVGTGGTASSGVITMPPAATAWNGSVENRTAVAANRADQRTVITASTTTSLTVQNQTISTGAALAWTASDVLHFVTTAD